MSGVYVRAVFCVSIWALVKHMWTATYPLFLNDLMNTIQKAVDHNHCTYSTNRDQTVNNV